MHELCLEDGTLIPIKISSYQDLTLNIIASRIAAKPKKLTSKQLARQQDIINKEIRNPHKEALRFAKTHHNKEGVNLPELQRVVEESESQKYIYGFARYVPGANVESLQQALLNAKLDAAYIRDFALNVPGADIDAFAQKIKKSKQVSVVLDFLSKVDVSDPGTFTKIFRLRTRPPGDYHNFDYNNYTKFFSRHFEKIKPNQLKTMIDLSKAYGNIAALAALKDKDDNLISDEDMFMAHMKSDELTTIIIAYEQYGMLNGEAMIQAFESVDPTPWSIRGHQFDVLLEILKKPEVKNEPSALKVAKAVFVPTHTGRAEHFDKMLDFLSARDTSKEELSKLKAFLVTVQNWEAISLFNNIFPGIEVEILAEPKEFHDFLHSYSGLKEEKDAQEYLPKWLNTIITTLNKPETLDKWRSVVESWKILSDDLKEEIGKIIPDNMGTISQIGPKAMEIIPNNLKDTFANEILDKMLREPGGSNWMRREIFDAGKLLSFPGVTEEHREKFLKLMKRGEPVSLPKFEYLTPEIVNKYVEINKGNPTENALNTLVDIDSQGPGKWESIREYVDAHVDSPLNPRQYENQGITLTRYMQQNELGGDDPLYDKINKRTRRHVIDQVLVGLEPDLIVLKRLNLEEDEEYLDAVKVRDEFPDVKGLKEVYENLQYEKQIEHTKYDKDLHQLKKLVDKGITSIQELKKANPKLMARLKPLVVFNQGKPITHEVIGDFIDTLDKFDIKIDKSDFKLKIQRSLEHRPGYRDVSQVVFHIIAGDKHVKEMKEQGIYEMFADINKSFSGSGHPNRKDQLGWVRFDVSLDKEEVLVDEIQSDISGRLRNIKEHPNHHSMRVEDEDGGRREATEEEIREMAKKLDHMMDDFPDIAMNVITQFAQKNEIKKIIWHTFAGGTTLKGNRPPKSLYEKLPKNHYFEVTEDRPFQLPAKFWAREASLAKIARRLARLIGQESLRFRPAPSGLV